MKKQKKKNYSATITNQWFLRSKNKDIKQPPTLYSELDRIIEKTQIKNTDSAPKLNPKVSKLDFIKKDPPMKFSINNFNNELMSQTSRHRQLEKHTSIAIAAVNPLVVKLTNGGKVPMTSSQYSRNLKNTGQQNDKLKFEESQSKFMTIINQDGRGSELGQSSLEN